MKFNHRNELGRLAFITEVSKFLMEQGYGCKVTKPSATVTAATSLAENGKPDIATEMWYNSAPVYGKLEKEGKVKTVANVFKDGGVEGWWIPAYLAKSNPELTKIEGVLQTLRLLVVVSSTALKVGVVV